VASKAAPNPSLAAVVNHISGAAVMDPPKRARGLVADHGPSGEVHDRWTTIEGPSPTSASVIARNQSWRPGRGVEVLGPGPPAGRH